jgi:hypothetical protein
MVFLQEGPGFDVLMARMCFYLIDGRNDLMPLQRSFTCWPGSLSERTEEQ